MRIAVFGASRHTGQAVVEQALAKGNIDITALVRTPSKLPYTEEQLSKITVAQGDATNKDDVAKAIENADIIVTSLGATPTGLTSANDVGVEETAVAHILQAIKETRTENQPRIIMVSSTGVGYNHDVPFILRGLYKIALATPHKHKLVAETAIKESGVPYTIVRPALLTSGKLTGKYRAEHGASGYYVSRADVAHFILEQCILEGKFVNESLSIAY
ncbi:hypothetical protein FBU59_001015 [Linderina macrospora]|uniref:Uncharacterized protein n=1 Tax=Linderina macrospora TaxID=4868 RepID=A0ACC1JFG9_9FUNG|nr:hypothetical protein FBU59_001015 [Linderina macrospora]